MNSWKPQDNQEWLATLSGSRVGEGKEGAEPSPAWGAMFQYRLLITLRTQHTHPHTRTICRRAPPTQAAVQSRTWPHAQTDGLLRAWRRTCPGLRGGQGRVPLSPAAALPRPPGTGVFGFVSLISFSETVVLFFSSSRRFVIIVGLAFSLLSGCYAHTPLPSPKAWCPPPPASPTVGGV